MCSAHLIPGIASAQGAERDQSKDAWKRRIRGILDRGRLPIIDLQATYMDATSPGVPPNVLQTVGATDVPRMIEDMNRLDAYARLQDIVQSVALPPKRRRATRPTRASKERRLQDKSQRSAIKELRGKALD